MVKTLYIVGRLNPLSNGIEPYEKGGTGKEIFVFTDQASATDCAMDMAKVTTGEWTVFEVKPLTTTKIVTVLHEEEDLT